MYIVVKRRREVKRWIKVLSPQKGITKVRACSLPMDLWLVTRICSILQPGRLHRGDNTVCHTG